MNSDLAPLRWLHLSDIHAGSRGKDVWWNTAQQFEVEITKQIEEKGIPDIIIITGDIAFSGKKEQYDEFSSFIHRLDGWFGKKLPIICVPGNHDLDRPDLTKTLNSGFKVLKKYVGGDDDVANLKKELWENKDTTILEPLFQAYQSFHDDFILPRLDEAEGIEYKKSGFFPGDIRVDIAIARKPPMTIIGLNSAWVQCSDDNYYGKLALEVGQIRELIEDEGASLHSLKETSSLIVMHHPYDWLHKDIQSSFNAEIYTLDRFDACLCGHMHEAQYISVTSSGTTRNYYQSPSLFGLEHWGTEKEEREIGYTLGQLDQNGSMRVWPYRLAKDRTRFIFDKEWVDADEEAGLEICPAKSRKRHEQAKPFEDDIYDCNDSPNPYKFLKFYDISEGEFLFGRGKLTKILLERIKKIFENERGNCFIGLTGRSGCGKSSVLRAGVLNQLETLTYYKTIAFRPTDFHDQHGNPQNIIQRIIGKIHNEVDIHLPNEVLINIERASGASRARMAIDEIEKALGNESIEEGRARLIIGLDQFEEVIDDLADDNQKEHWRDLVEFVERGVDSSSIGFIHTLESTRKGLASQTDVAHLLTEYYDVDGYSKDFVYEIITKPFKRAGYPLNESEGEIVSVLLENTNQLRNEVKGDEADSLLPLLALSLARLFDVVKSKAKKRKTYDSTETLRQTQNTIGLEILDDLQLLDIKSSIKNEVQRVWDGDSDDLGHFLRPLLRISDISSDNFILRKVPIHPYSGDKKKAENFVRNRLLVKEGNRIRLVHEAVIRFWPEASEWLEKEKDRLKIESEFRAKAHRWFEGDLETPDDDIDFAADILSSYHRSWAIPCDEELDQADVTLRNYCLAVFSRSNDPLRLVDSSAKTEARHVHLAASYNQVELLEKYKYINKESLSLPRKDKRTPLHNASWGAVEAVKFLLKEGVSAVSKDEDGWYPLSAAIVMGNMEIFHCLIGEYEQAQLEDWPRGSTVLHQFGSGNLAKEHHANHLVMTQQLVKKHGIDPNLTDSDGRIPLHWIAHANDRKLFEYFSDVSDVNKVDNFGWNALHYAASQGSNEVIDILLGLQKFSQKSKDALTSVNAPAGPGYNALHLSILNKYPETVKLLLDNGIDPAKKASSKSHQGRCALLMAAKSLSGSSTDSTQWEDKQKALKIVKYLLEHPNIDLNARDLEQHTALSLGGAMPELVKMLLSDNRLDPNSPISPNGPAPMLVSANLSDWAITDRLLSISNDSAHFTRTNDGDSLLHLLIRKKAPRRLIKKTLELSPVLSQANDDGYTPLMLAVVNNDPELVRLMPEFGKGVKSSTLIQGSALKVALEKDSPQETLDELVNTDAVLQLISTDESGWSAQHVACVKGGEERIDWVSEQHGSGLNRITDHWGRVPFDLAPVSLQKKWDADFRQQLHPQSWDGKLDWKPYKRSYLRELIQSNSPVNEKFDITEDTTAEHANLSFYDKKHTEIIRLRNKDWPKDLCIYFIAHTDKDKRTFYHLNGSSPPIHELNRLEGVLSLTKENVRDYIRFFCFFVRGEDGAFLIAESLEQCDMPRNLSQKSAELLGPLIGPAKYFGQHKGQFRVSAVVYYSEALFFADFTIQDSGFVEMEKDLLMLKDLPKNENIPIS